MLGCLHPSCIVLLFFRLGGFENARCVGGACSPLVHSHLFTGIDGSSRLCSVLGVLAPLPHCLLYFLWLRGFESVQCVGGACSPPARSLIYWLALTAG